jgi:cellulose synthase/poly-beta-1,6-N-acetylglucosamine synthase-like glycosyltransferase
MGCPTVSVVVPARNAEATVQECLASLMASHYPAELREVVVVDNASTDRTGTIVRGFPVRCVFEPERGPAPARNRGIQASHGEIVAFTDADCVVTEGWLRELVAGFADGDSVWAVAGEIGAYRPTTPAQRYMARRRPWMQKPALSGVRPYFATGNVAFRRETFARVGLFDPRFVTGEDQDFAWRFLGAGLSFRYAPRAVVLHRHRATSWQFFRQQLAWARGSVLLRRHHQLPWGARAELAEYLTLARAIGDLVRTTLAPPVGDDALDRSYAFHAVLREIAWRLAGLAAWRPFWTPRVGRSPWERSG